MTARLPLGSVIGLIGLELMLIRPSRRSPDRSRLPGDARVSSGDGAPIRLAVLGDSTVAGVGSAIHPSPIGYGFWADAPAPVVIDGLEA